MNEGDTNQPMDDDIKQHNLSKKSKEGGDADGGNSEEEEKEEERYTEGDTNQPMDDDIKQHNLSKKSKEGGDADGGNSEEEEEKEEERYTDNGLDTVQPEDTDTGVHNQQKESKKAEVTGQSDAAREDLDTLDGKCIKGKNEKTRKEENSELPQAREGPRLRTPYKKQKLAHRGEGDICGHVETKRNPVAADASRCKLHLIILSLIVFVGLCVGLFYLRTPSPTLQNQLNLLEVFNQVMDKVKASFPSQHCELWRRSRIHLQKHLNLTDPTEPVSLILTSGRGAEKTLGCLAQQLAAAFSTTLNSSVLGIDGTSKSEQDSDQVKLDIDKALKEAFEGGTQAAVIHHFEALPPGSTLIFYRYCDHENAAFKKVFLAFTVMLQEDMDFPPNISLGMVEEMVQEYLKEKFVSSDRTAKFNQMDLDKLSGLWSRISHVILPVAPEQKIEQHGCQT